MKKSVYILSLAAFLSAGLVNADTTTLKDLGSSAVDAVVDAQGDAVLDAALSTLNLDQAKLDQVKPVVRDVVSKGKQIMQQYDYDPANAADFPADKMDLMKSAFSSLKGEAASALSEKVEKGVADQIQGLISEKLLGGLL